MENKIFNVDSVHLIYAETIENFDGTKELRQVKPTSSRLMSSHHKSTVYITYVSCIILRIEFVYQTDESTDVGPFIFSWAVHSI